MIKAILTKPLDGMPEGTEREFDPDDFQRLHDYGAVREASGLREDGPTIAEYLAAGYLAANYPPSGYASRSTDEEIAAAIAAANGGGAAIEHGSDADGDKAGLPVANKMAPEPENKMVTAPADKAPRARRRTED